MCTLAFVNGRFVTDTKSPKNFAIVKCQYFFETLFPKGGKKLAVFDLYKPSLVGITLPVIWFLIFVP